MCVILEADFIVGLTVKGKSVLNTLLNSDSEIEFSIDDCLKRQQKCRCSGWGNVIAESTEDDFENYLRRNREYFELMPNGRYRINRGNLNYKNSDEIDYERLLTLGIYNGAICDTFNYPKRKITIS